MSLTDAPCSHLWAPTELSYFTTAYSAALCVVTITGNILVCVAVYKDPHKKLRTPFMYILVNLAVTDLIVGLFTLPIIVATHALEAIHEKKETHTIIARMTYFVSKTASIMNLTAFCVDRYVAINWPIKYRRLLNSRVCLILFATIWVLASALACIYYGVGFMNFIIAFAQISFILVLVIFSVTFRLLRTLSKYSKERKSIANTKESHRKSDRRVTKLFLTMLFMFFVCYTPAIVFMYIIKFCTNCDCTTRHVVRDLQFLFICSNSAINPFLCTIRLKPFRAALSMIFHCKSKSPSTDFDTMDSPPTMSALRRFSRRVSSIFTTIDEDDETNTNGNLIKLQMLNNGTGNGESFHRKKSISGVEDHIDGAHQRDFLLKRKNNRLSVDNGDTIHHNHSNGHHLNGNIGNNGFLSVSNGTTYNTSYVLRTPSPVISEDRLTVNTDVPF